MATGSITASGRCSARGLDRARQRPPGPYAPALPGGRERTAGWGVMQGANGIQAANHERARELVFAIAHEVGNQLGGIRMQAHLLDEGLEARAVAAASSRRPATSPGSVACTRPCPCFRRCAFVRTRWF